MLTMKRLLGLPALVFALVFAPLLPAHAFSQAYVVDLGSLGGSESWALGINDLGQVVGYSDTDSGENYQYRRHAFLWTAKDGMRDLGMICPHFEYHKVC